MELWRKCLITGKEFTTSVGFTNHLRGLKITSKEYYDKYHKQSNEGVCYCGKGTTYHAWSYATYCSDVCSNKSERHRKRISERFIINPPALESFRIKRKEANVDVNVAKRRKTIEQKAFNLGMTAQEWYSAQGKRGALSVSKEDKERYTAQAMNTRESTGNHGSRSYIKPYDLFGESIGVQGYEPYVLDFLIQTMNIKSDELIAGKGRVPQIKYDAIDGVQRTYFPDIFLPKANMILEVKSTYTYGLHKDNVHRKAIGCIETGYSIFILVLDKARKSELEGFKNLLDWAISSRAPKPIWYGAGSTTIPQGSREQANGSRNMTILNEDMI